MKSDFIEGAANRIKEIHYCKEFGNNERLESCISSKFSNIIVKWTMDIKFKTSEIVIFIASVLFSLFLFLLQKRQVASYYLEDTEEKKWFYYSYKNGFGYITHTRRLVLEKSEEVKVNRKVFQSIFDSLTQRVIP